MAQENREMTNLEISHDPSINGQHWFSPQMGCSPAPARGGTWRRLSLLSQELRRRRRLLNMGQPSTHRKKKKKKGLRSKEELYQPPDPPQAPSPPQSTYPTWNFHLDQTRSQSCRQKRPSSVRPRMVQGGVVGVLVSVREGVKTGGRIPSFGSLAREVAAIRHIVQ